MSNEHTAGDETLGTAPLSDQQLLRYSRQILLPEVDFDGQDRLRASRALLVGAGGLASPAALYLAGAGIGELIIADHDQLEISNLHRQIAFRHDDVGSNKAEALAQQLRALNSDVTITTHTQAADADWLTHTVPQVQVVLDCSDNFATRAAVNRACVAARVPLVSGAAIRFSGQLAVFDLRQADAPCYACLFGDQDDDDQRCRDVGILGPVVGTIGTLQALQAIRVLLGETIPATLQLFEGATLGWQTVQIKRDPGCPVCS